MEAKATLPAFTRRIAPFALTVALFTAACAGAAKAPADEDASAAPSASETATAAAPGPAPTETPAPAVLAPPAVTPTLTAANAALDAGNYSEAAAAYAAVAAAARAPNERATALLGESLARGRDGDGDGSLRLLREAAAAAPRASLTAARAAYLLARQMNDSGQPAEAVSAATTVIPAEAGVLRLYIQAEHARALSLGGNATGAGAAWDAILADAALDGPLRAAVALDRANAGLRTGDRGAAVRWLAEHVRLAPTPAARYRLAELAREAGDSATFATQLRALLAQHPSSREAVLAAGLLKDAAITYDRGQEGLVYYRRGALPEARRTLEEAVLEPGLTPAQLAFRTYYLAAANEDAGLYAAALALYDRATSYDPASPFTHRGRYWAARTAEEMGDPGDASARYVALSTVGPAGEFSSESAFRAGYVLLAAGDPAAALAAWAVTAPGESRDGRLFYWRGRAREQLGDRAGANESYRRAVSDAPLTFYALQAAARLGLPTIAPGGYRTITAGPVDWDAIAAWLVTREPGTLPPSRPSAAPELVAIGLPELAEAALLERAEGGGAWQLLALARDAREAGLPRLAARFAGRILAATGTREQDAPRPLLQVLLPLSYVETIQSEARSAGLDPLLVAAVIQQESAWDPRAVSSANARGLMQIIPSTAEGIAEALALPGFGVDHLFRPGVSIRFGTYYLRGQLQRFGSPLAALAAYNGGPGNVQRWMAVARPESADFVEAITFAETKEYVERVMDHYARYRWAYQGEMVRP